MNNWKPIPLKYYKIEQAAEANSCEVRDILQLGAEGRLECCVFLSAEEVLPHFLRDGEGVWFFSDSKDAESDPLLDQKRRRCEYLQEFFSFNKHPLDMVSKYSRLWWDCEKPAIYGDGLWLLSPADVRGMVAGKWPALPKITLWPAGKDKPDGELRLSYVTVISECDNVLDVSQIYIAWDDFKRIEECIENRKLLDVLPHFRPFLPSEEPVVNLGTEEPVVNLGTEEPVVNLGTEVPAVNSVTEESVVNSGGEAKVYPGKYGPLINAVKHAQKEWPDKYYNIAAAVREVKVDYIDLQLDNHIVSISNMALEKVLSKAIKRGCLPAFKKK